MDPATAYFLKKYYPHVIKWWLVNYNPDVIRIWPSKAEEEEALRLEAEEAEQMALEAEESSDTSLLALDESAYNATTGSYSGLYGQTQLDAEGQAALDVIMNTYNKQNNIDFLISGGNPSEDDGRKKTYITNDDITIPSDQDEILKEANEIYERLLREADEDEEKKKAEIEAARQSAQQQYS